MKQSIKNALRGPHRTFLRYIEKERFNPGILGLFINPFYFARKGLYRELKPLSRHLTGTLLDVGCGTKPYKKLFVCEKYDGLEIDTPKMRAMGSAEYFYDGKRFPFANETYDSVLCNQVLEHVFEPDAFLAEMHRVLKGGGHLLLTVPFVWDEHDQPYDYARYSSFGIIHLLEKHGFTIIKARKSTPTIATVFQLINGYLYKKTNTKNLYLNLLITFFIMMPWNVLGLMCETILPKNQDLYLDNIILAKKL